jgi:hypothetical protein
MAGDGVEVDAAAQAFTEKVFGMIAGGVSAFIIDLGLRTGLFDAGVRCRTAHRCRVGGARRARRAVCAGVAGGDDDRRRVPVGR